MAGKEQMMSIFTGINQLYSGRGKAHLFQYPMYNDATLSVHGKHKRAVKAQADISCGHRTSDNSWFGHLLMRNCPML